MSDARDRGEATVWAAEHGASNPDLGLQRVGSGEDDSPANVGHRFRIHGRLTDESPEPLPGTRPGMKLDPEFLRQLVAHETEVDVRDVHLVIEQQKIVLDGSVNDEGERQEIEALLARIPGVSAIDNRLRVHTA
jgi:BON domain